MLTTDTQRPRRHRRRTRRQVDQVTAGGVPNFENFCRCHATHLPKHPFSNIVRRARVFTRCCYTLCSSFTAPFVVPNPNEKSLHAVYPLRRSAVSLVKVVVLLAVFSEVSPGVSICEDRNYQRLSLLLDSPISHVAGVILQTPNLNSTSLPQLGHSCSPS